MKKGKKNKLINIINVPRNTNIVISFQFYVIVDISLNPFLIPM